MVMGVSGAHGRVAWWRPGPMLRAAAAGAAAALLGAAPAAAGPGNRDPRPFVDCVVVTGDGFQAVFGYEKATGQVTIPVGPLNQVSPASLDGGQPTQFKAGWRPGVLVLPPVPVGSTVSWTVDGLTATATAGSQVCGPRVSLPAEGNGAGPVLVLVGSVAVSMGFASLRRRMQARRGDA
jgi:hypothetical protein